MEEKTYTCYVCGESVSDKERTTVKFLQDVMTANAQEFYPEDLGLVHCVDDGTVPSKFDEDGDAVVCLSCHQGSLRRYNAIADGLARHSLVFLSATLIDEVENAIRVQHPSAFAKEWMPDASSEPVNTLLFGEAYYALEDKITDMVYEHIEGGDPHRCADCDGTLWRLQKKTVADGGRSTVAVCLRCGYEDNV